jgi:hypothetical protein
MKKIVFYVAIASVFGCTPTHHAMFEKVSQEVKVAQLGEKEIGNALKEALVQGVNKEVTKLGNYNGFFTNDLVKIGLPGNLTKVDETLRNLGMASIADKGLELLNHAAEDAVKSSKTVLVDAIKQMSIADAKNILLGSENAATLFLEEKTTQDLYTKFYPIVTQSLSNVKADEHWKKIIKQYNDLPLVREKINPDLADFVTQETIKGMFVMVALEEKEIRNNTASRTTRLMKDVFALQDN